MPLPQPKSLGDAYVVIAYVVLWVFSLFYENGFPWRIGNDLSDCFPQKGGVPRGGVLSVALFALMINDIVNVPPQSIGRSLFVGHFAVWCISLSTPSLEVQLQLAVTKLERCVTMNGFRFSTPRTRAAHFCRRRGDYAGVPKRIYGVNIPLDRAVRFLDPTMDSRLTYREHFTLLGEGCGSQKRFKMSNA